MGDGRYYWFVKGTGQGGSKGEVVMKDNLIYIEWADAIASDADWVNEEEMNEWIDDTEWIIKQCGFIVKETKEYILLAGHIKPKDSYTEKQYGHLQKIPKTWIRKRVVIKI